MRSLFNAERETYTAEGDVWAARAREVLRPLILDAAKHGASLRDLHYILTGEVSVTVSEFIIRRNLGKLEKL